MINEASRRFALAAALAVCACLLAQTGASADPTPLASGDQQFGQRELAVAKQFYLQHYQQQGAINDTLEQKEANTHAIMRLGHCCLGLEQYAEAREWFARAIALRTDDVKVRARAQCDLGVAYASQGLTDLAIQNLEQVVTSYPQQKMACAAALLKITELQATPGHYGEEIETLNRLIRDYASSRTAWKRAKHMLAEALDSNLRINDSLQLVDELLASSEYDASDKGMLSLTKADVQLRASRFAACKETCQRTLADVASSPWMIGGAKRILIQALCEDGTDPDRALLLIEEMRDNNLYADPLYRAQLVLWKGLSEWLRGNYDKAEDCFTQIISDFQDQTDLVGEAYFHRARLRATSLRAFDNAAADIDRIPVPYLKHFAQGELYMTREQSSAAAAEYEQVIASLPSGRVPNTEPVLAFKRLATCYDTLSDTAKADDARSRLTQFESTHK